jgi:pimeloyl-ACP methyl ester carboxylesterase
MLKTCLYKGEKVFFTDTGKGRVVVLLHGFLGSKQIWKKTAENLARSYRVISIDLPGHGQSPCYGYVHSMELMAKCVKAVMDSLRLKRYVIVGHSMGGYAALAFADLFPDNLRGLCLFHSTAYPESQPRHLHPRNDQKPFCRKESQVPERRDRICDRDRTWNFPARHHRGPLWDEGPSRPGYYSGLGGLPGNDGDRGAR